ncbi:MAG: aminoacyl-tRNA hydrolase [Candidatus Electrothrix sp. AR4]|nr:aminoacyl-tRNA hydrolase [Candidatus Electrothrix sp. AR4]
MKEQYFITSSVVIPASALSFTYSRSSGKGGQHVNKVNTKVSLRFDLNASQALSEGQKQLLRQRLAGRLNNLGILRLDGDRQRSQIGNREEVVRRFVSLLQAALHVNKSRRKTKPSKNAKKRRLQVKKKRGQLKRQRGKRDFNQD